MVFVTLGRGGWSGGGRLGGGVLRGRFTVTHVDRPAGVWGWRLVFLGVPVRVGHTVAADGSGTRVTVELSAVWPVPLLYAPVVVWALHRLTRV
ncbi:hypothetical protein [Streptomyces sp. NPDC004682]